MQQNARAGLEEVLVDEGHDGHVVFGAGRARNDGVVVVDKLFEVADTHGAASHVVNPRPLIGVAVALLRTGVDVDRPSSLLDRLRLADPLLVLDVLLL